MLAPKYPKTDGLYVRDSSDPSVVTSEHRHPVYSQIKGWWVEEKLDGTNCRIILDPTVEAQPWDVRGRSDAATLSGHLRTALEATAQRAWATDNVPVLFEEPVCLYGEGIGIGIQGNPYQLDTCDFRLFDIKVGDHPERGWLAPQAVHDVAEQLNIEAVPVLSRNVTLAHAEGFVRNGCFQTFLLPDSQPRKAEGVVCKTRVPIYDARGRLIRLKFKPANLPTRLTSVLA